jgi:hypothetical protein
MLLTVFFLGALSLAGCRQSSGVTSSLVFEHQVDPQPPRSGPATITIKLTTGAGQPIQKASVRLEGNMTHPGMAPSFGDAVEISPGQYRGPLEFSMGGDWVVLAHINLADGQKIEKQFEVKGVRSP